jgi:hypothetical protein
MTQLERRAVAFAVRRASAYTFALAALVVLLPTGFTSAGPGGPVSGFRVGPEIAASKDIDVDTLRDDLGSTDAIDFITKLNLKSELDSLIEAFREYHDGSGGHSLAALYARFDHLLRTTLALIEDSDPPLFLKLNRSRPKLWQILVDREEFHAMMEDTDVELLKGSARQ